MKKMGGQKNERGRTKEWKGKWKIEKVINNIWMKKKCNLIKNNPGRTDIRMNEWKVKKKKGD